MVTTKYYKADVRREQATLVYFSAKEGMSKSELRRLAEQAAENVVEDWANDHYSAFDPVEIGEKEAAEYEMDLEA